MQGINAGLAWVEFADIHVFYIDYGMSKGMKDALLYSLTKGLEVEYRKLVQF